LFQRLDPLFSHLLHFSGENGFGRGGAVDTIGLDTDDDAAADFQEQMCVEPHDTRLIGLGDVGEDDVDHGDEHAVAQGVAGVFDDGDDVGAVRGHVDEVAAGAVGELDGEDGARGADDVGDVRDRRPGCGSEV